MRRSNTKGTFKAVLFKQKKMLFFNYGALFFRSSMDVSIITPISAAWMQRSALQNVQLTDTVQKTCSVQRSVGADASPDGVS